ncbi:MAG: SDR family oxidoreductase [Bacteroidia bacterium]|nr:SDR family oxidoreductase [Bacteroidia bacterium]
MKKTVLITGSSSGIGNVTAKYFAQNGWNVAATMRHPEKDETLKGNNNIKLYTLDVLNEENIATVIKQTIADFGKIDVIVNNAGYGAVGIFEAATAEQIKKQFDTNVFGVMNMIRAILPHFRANRNGHIINITSVGGIITFPIYSVYHGTKWALEGFTESLSFELKPFNIKVKNVEPGAIKTDFYSRSQDLFKKDGLTDYDNYATVTFKNTQQAGANAPGPEVVAKVIFKAANDDNFKLRYPVGSGAPFLIFLRKIIPLSWFKAMVGMVIERGL